MGNEEKRRIIVVGDIHGCYSLMIKALRDADYDGGRDILVFVGDYVDRGRYGRECLDYVMRLSIENKDVYPLLGNHEDMMATALLTGDWDSWYYNGGESTVLSYIRYNYDLTEHLDFLQGLAPYYKNDSFGLTVAHAAYPFLPDGTEKPIDEIIWDRSWIQKEAKPYDGLFIFGHTPAKTAYHTENNSLCIDSGCVYTGILSYAVIEKDENGKITVQVRSVKQKD